MSTIPFAELIQVAPPGVDLGAPATPPPPGSWLATELEIAGLLGLPTAAWQAGQPLRTMLSLSAVVQSNQDTRVSAAIQGGLLDFAATGTVDSYDLDGNATQLPVSVDPSAVTPTPTAAVTWLDALASSQYDVERIAADYAKVTIAISNSTASTYPQAAGAMHVANLGTGATYTNRDAISITPTTNIGGGIASTADNGAGAVRVATESAHGLTSGAIVTVAGTSTAADGTWPISVFDATHFDLVGSSFGGAASTGTVNAAAVLAVFVADAIGPVGSSVAGGIAHLVTPMAGVSVANPAACVGPNWETNVALANRCRLSFAARSANGPDAAYEFVALTASQLLAEQTPTVTLEGGPITRVLVSTDPYTGNVIVSLANAAGAVSGCVDLAVSGVTSSGGLCAVSTVAPHGLATGNYATVSGVVGVPGANVTSTIQVTGSTSFSLDGSTFTGAYVSGGTVEGGDLGELDALLEAMVVPKNVTEITQSASTTTVNVAADLYLPAAAIAEAIPLVNSALLTYFAQLPIGGATDPAGAFTNVVPLDGVEGEVYGAIKPLGGQSARVTLNGARSNVSVGATAVAVLGSLTVTGHGV